MINNFKINLTKTSLCILSSNFKIINRHHGGRNVGHIHKIMNAISRNKNLPASSTTLSFTPKSQNTTPNLSPTDVPQACETNSSQITSIAKHLGIEKIAKESVTRSRAQISQKSNEALDIYLQKNQRAISEFCKHFEQIPLDQFLNDPKFISYFINLIQEKPYLLSRPFALALEVTYNKRFFDPNFLETFHNITLNNSFNLSNVMVDQSSLYTFLVSNFILNSNSPFEKIKNIAINPTPNEKFNITEFSSTLQVKALLNKTLTGNVTNDFDFENHPYDLKHTSKIEYGKNQIYILDQEQINQIVPGYFKNLHTVLQQKKLSCMDKSEQEYLNACIEKLYSMKDSKLTSQQQFEIWNIFVVASLSKRPPNCTIPIVIPSTKNPFIHDPTDTYNNIDQNLRKKKLDAPEVQQAIIEVVEKNKNTMAEAAKKSTLGKIDVDETSSNSTNEVD